MINLLVQQAAIAFSAGAVGLILLLLVGTQILDWQWPAVLFLAVFAIGTYRVTRRVLSNYKLAQKLDRLLGLQDGLSTAFYFRRLAPTVPQSVEVVEKQALEHVRPGDVERALPLAFPRAGYAACALAFAAMGLLGVRYGVLRTLNLERPLARIEFDTFRNPPKVEAASAKKSVVQEHLEKQLQQLGLSLDELQTEKEAEKPNPTNVGAVADEPGSQKGTPGKGPNPAAEGAEEGKSDDESSGKSSGESKDEGAGQPSAAQKGQQGSPSPPKGKPNPGNNPGVLDKMKDALANLLNKLGQPQQKGEESASNQNQQQGGKQQPGQKGQQGQGKTQGDSQSTSDQQQGGEESDSADKAQGDQQRASQQDSNKGSENSKSGMGKSDGDKTIQDAEQLAAMGKISEIFGKRAAEIQGEMSVEVPSGKQQLKTAYSRSSANHAGAIADSNRNEIPLIYQTYVQRYFEEVRKTAAKQKTATP